MKAAQLSHSVHLVFAEGVWAGIAAGSVSASASLCFTCRLVCDIFIDLVKSDKNNHWGFVLTEADSNALSSNSCITAKALAGF